MGEREIERDLTRKSNDVQRYAIHSSENVRCDAVGWTVMNLRLPEFAHLSASNMLKTRANEEGRGKV